MSEKIRITGIVLSAFPVGENDRRLTILSRERGKIQVFSRGSRRVKHPLHAASQPLVAGEFMIAETRQYAYLDAAECSDFFPYVKDTLEKICYSTYFAELSEYFSVEGQDGKDLLNLLVVTFFAMKKALVPLPLIRRIFEMKLLQLSGFGMECFSCVKCGKTEHLGAISFREGGVVCEDCAKKTDGRPLSSQVRYVLQVVSAAPLEKLYTFTLEENVQTAFSRVVRRFFAQQARHSFRSASMLDELS